MFDALAVVVVNYGSAHLLARNLVRVQTATPGSTIIVVDNRTTPTERDEVVALGEHHGWEVVLPSSNLGFGVGVNVGARRAMELGCSRLLIVNPDAWLETDAVASMLSRVEADPMALVAPRIVRPDGSVWSVGHEMSLASGAMRRCPGLRASSGGRAWLSGAVLLTTTDLWRVVGGFDARYFLYWEDVDLSHKVVAAGGRLILEDRAEAVHDEGGTQLKSGRAMSTTYYYYNVRNRLLYAAIHLDPAQRRNWRRTTLRRTREILLRGGKRQFSRPVGPVRAAVRGIRDGRRMMRDLDRGDRTSVPAQNWP